MAETAAGNRENASETADPMPIREQTLLIGEGMDEVQFFRAILKHMSITNVQVEQYGGKSKLKTYLKTLLVRPGFLALKSVGITRDADADDDAAFQSVNDALQAAGLRVLNRGPEQIEGRPRTSIFIFPGTGDGMLEDLCLRSVASDQAITCVDEYLTCVAQRAKREPKTPSKARVQVWLASLEESDLRLGLAAQNKYWPWESPAFDDVKNFLRSL